VRCSICVLNREKYCIVYVDRNWNSVVKDMLTELGTVCYSICGMNRENCFTVYVDRNGKSVVEDMWTEQGTVW
jgi:hypothetical protein